VLYHKLELYENSFCFLSSQYKKKDTFNMILKYISFFVLFLPVVVLKKKKSSHREFIKQKSKIDLIHYDQIKDQLTKQKWNSITLLHCATETKFQHLQTVLEILLAINIQ